MNLTTPAIAFTEEYQATIIPIHLIPFAMIVGFFPISFSLIIALEAFVGEKERNTLEPLLTTPLSDESLYTGKLLASVLPPLVASFIGIAAYLITVYYSMNYVPELIILVQILLLTTMEALVMVAGAVVVSSHTTSVRAANLLASFIIVPVAFLIQAESIFLFWGQYNVLWYIIAALAVADAILIRTGVRTFNREELLAREIDELNLGSTIRLFLKYLEITPFSLAKIYLHDLPRILRDNRASIVLTLIVLIGGMLMGWLIALQYPLPETMGSMFHVNADTFKNELQTPGFDFLPSLNPRSIFSHNLRTLALSALLGMFSFGVLALILLIAPMGIIGFIAEQALRFGYSPITFLLAFIAPHGISKSLQRCWRPCSH
jgi:ABC-type Na+ efflux pump permease subunit